MAAWLALPGLIIWCAVLLLPWQPWRTRERIEADPDARPDLSDITVLVPARDEADVIERTLAGLKHQGSGLKVVVVNDQSEDETGSLARHAGAHVIDGTQLPEGWTGKLWALEQAYRTVETGRVLLLDADIELRPGVLYALLRRMETDGRQLVSAMASLSMSGFWEGLLLPAFIYFFKLLYPFRLANSRFKLIAASAGGCVLLETRVLKAIGGFGALRGEIIDDCALARQVKNAGFLTWVGLSRDVISLRRYDGLSPIAAMVTRSAYTQLRYSVLLLLLCTLVMACAFWLPPAMLLAGNGTGRILAGASLLAMMATYLPTLRFYKHSPAWALALPLTGSLYMGMTWLSALKYWRGIRSQWKARTYDVSHGDDIA